MTTVNNNGEMNIFVPLGSTSSTDVTPGTYFLTILESTLVYQWAVYHWGICGAG